MSFRRRSVKGCGRGSENARDVARALRSRSAGVPAPWHLCGRIRRGSSLVAPGLRPGRFRTTAALIAILLALAGGGAARAFEASPYGINIHAPSDPKLEPQLDRVAAAGIGWVRIDFVWAVVQPTEGTWDWRLYDRIAAEAAARGLEVFATLAYTPAWATSGPLLSGVPNDPAAWREFCRRAARRYAGTIRYWGLWNEANLPRFWSGSRGQYLDLIVGPGIAGVRAGNPAALVGGPDLAHLTSGDSDWYDWLRSTLLAYGDQLDFVTHHLYDDDGPADVTDKLDDSTLFGSRPSFWDTVTPSVREVLESAGAEDKPFWLTETGWASDRVGEARQASHYTGLLDRWFTARPGQDWIAKVFFYELVDDPAAGVPKWGVLDPASGEKPAYAAYRDFIRAHPGAPPDAAAVAETVPSTMETGQTVTVELTFLNRGGTVWTGAGLYALTAEGGLVAGAAPVPLALDESIEPGESKTFTVDLTAPSPAGTYSGAWRMARNGAPFGEALTATVAVATAPLPSKRRLRLLDDRFRLEVSWRDHQDRSGFARSIPSSDGSGFFWFFGPDNVELVVKMLDGRPVNGRFWVFWAGLTDVEYWLTVTDLETNAVRTYHNPSGSSAGGADTAAFP